MTRDQVKGSQRNVHDRDGGYKARNNERRADTDRPVQLVAKEAKLEKPLEFHSKGNQVQFHF